MLTNTTKSPYAKTSPLPFDAVTWTDGFWADACERNTNSTVPHLRSMFESKDISHVVENFKICAGESEGEFGGTNFGDGDFYKWMEAAMYSASKTGDKTLLAQIDSYVDLIGRAQLPDGYISTKQILGERQNSGVKRLGDINDFEVYNFGHLFTAACLYKRITGRDNFVKIAEKAAGYLEHLYADNSLADEVKTAVCPSHYMGLLELYRTTEDKRYLELAKTAIAMRDSVKDGTDDNQDRIPLKTHRKIVGHAVRSNYLYAGVADLYLETGDEEYLTVLNSVWRNLVDQKLYLTGGCGALYNGASPYGNFFHHQKVHQAYGYEYQLPNVTAYNETCASVGSVLWAYRMFQLDPKAEYFDIIERTMLNVLPAAVSLDGKKYFYENMLRRAKSLPYELIWPLTRSEYILSYCCPPNLSRTIAESSEYAYLISDDAVWIGMYGASRSKITLACGSSFTLIQETAYPYDGKIVLRFEDVKDASTFKMNIRIPKWAVSGNIKAGSRTITLTDKDAGSYLTLETFLFTDIITINLDMPVRLTTAHGLVEETVNQAAVERGPLVYCIESPDSKLDTLDDLLLDLKTEYKVTTMELENRSICVLECEAYQITRPSYERDALYQTLTAPILSKTPVRLIPYFAWDNRGNGEMRIWIPIAYT